MLCFTVWFVDIILARNPFIFFTKRKIYRTLSVDLVHRVVCFICCVNCLGFIHERAVFQAVVSLTIDKLGKKALR